MQIKNLISAINKFITEREGAWNEYFLNMHKIADAKGTPFYENKAKEYEETRDGKISRLERDWMPVCRLHINDARRAFENTKIVPLTDDERVIIEMLKSARSVTASEFEAAARSLKDNPFGLKLLTEAAHEKGIHRNFSGMAKTLDSETGLAILKTMEASIEEIFESPFSRASMLAAEHAAEHYGTSYDIEKIPRIKPFSDSLQGFSRLAKLEFYGAGDFAKLYDQFEATTN